MPPTDQMIDLASLSRTTNPTDLIESFDTENLQLCYEPTFALDHGRLLGFEAHLASGRAGPAVLDARATTRHAVDIPGVLEDKKCPPPLELGALAVACSQTAAWRVMRPDLHLRTWVAVAGRQLAQRSLPTKVDEILKSTNMAPMSLWIEIMGSALTHANKTQLRVLRDLRSMGVQFSLTDAGVGTSSITAVQNFPVDAIRIDRRFVEKLGRRPEESALVSALLHLSSSLGIEAHASGVETMEQLDELRRLGCDVARGALWSKALPAIEVDSLLASGDDTLARRAARVALASLGSRRPPTSTSPTPVVDDPVALVAHEMRAPLQVIVGYTQALVAVIDRDLGEAGAEISGALEVIARQAGRLERLIRGLTDSAALDAGCFSLEPVRVELAAFSRDLLEELAIQDKEHKLELNVEGAVEAFVDPLRLSQILANLVVNALRHSPPEAPVSMKVEGHTDTVAIHVVDRGRGVPSERVGTLFTRYAPSGCGGTGLGLYLSRRLARAHGGDLAYHRAEGGGAEFVLTLPTASRRRGPSGRKALEPPG